LLRIRDFHSKDSKLEFVASRVEENGEMTRILFADDVDIGKSGKVYFTDGR